MRKTIFLFLATLMATLAWGGNWNGPAALRLNVNGTTAYHRVTSDQWWKGFYWEIANGADLSGADLGECRALKIVGAAASGSTDGNDYYDATTFRINYRVYPVGCAEKPAYSQIQLTTAHADNTSTAFRFDATADINLLEAVNGKPGNYVLEAQLLRNKKWDNGSASGSWDNNADAITATFSVANYIVTDGWSGNAWWTSVDDNKMTDGSITINDVPAGEHIFRITTGKWASDGGLAWGYTELNPSHANSKYFYTHSDNNIKFRLESTGNVTISIVNGLIEITTTGTFAPRYYLSGSGLDGLSWDAASIPMPDDEITFHNVAAGNYEVKVTNGSWTKPLGYSNVDAGSSSAGYYLSGDNNNLGFQVYYPCDVTIRVINGQIAITGSFVRYYVAGNGGNDTNGSFCNGKNWWTTGGAEFPSAATITFPGVAEGSYAFQLASSDWGVKNYNFNQAASNIALTLGGGANDNVCFTLEHQADVTISLSTDQQIAVNVTYIPDASLTISQYGFSSFYSDHAVLIPAGVKAYIISDVNGSALLKEQITDVIPANTGVILQGTANASYDLFYTTSGVTYPTNLLKGTLVDTDINNSETHYILGVYNNQCGIYWPAGTTEGVGSFNNKAGKAYLELSASLAPSHVRGFVLSATDTPTAVQDLENDNRGLYYDVLGRSYSEPIGNGLYIHQGKKVFISNK